MGGERHSSDFHEFPLFPDTSRILIMPELAEKELQKFLKELMDIQRHFANEQKNQNSKRQSDVKELLEKFVARESKNEN
jgi:predicted sugar kinase